MRPGLLGLLLLFTGQLVPVYAGYSVAVAGAGSLNNCLESDIQNNGKMCFFKFQCPNFLTICKRYASNDAFVRYFPACCLDRYVFSRNKKTCYGMRKYALSSRCDPKEHTVLKVESRPTTTTTTTTTRAPIRNNNGGSTGGIKSGFSRVSSLQLSICPKKVRHSKYIRRYPFCCYHPVIYNRFKKECAFLGDYKRRKRNADFISRAWDSLDEAAEEDLPEGELSVPENNMHDMEIEVKCCGSSGTELKKCRGADCFYVCDGSSGDAIVDTIDVTSSDDLCNPEITGESSGGRKKRSAWSAATMASWKVNWCPRYVTEDHGWWIRWYKICCFHPGVRKHPMNKKAKPKINNGKDKNEWKKKKGGVANYCNKLSSIFSKWEDD